MTDFINWDDKWNTGIKKIDTQHKHFVELINKVYALNQDDKHGKKIDALLSDLTEYARIHFTTEEEYFKQTEYPGADDHIEKHGILLGKVLEFNRRFEAKENGQKLLTEFLVFLRAWLDEHLTRVDHKYIPWLTSHGIK